MANFTEGYKQTYYLNSISTRSHTALFVKSVRQDGRGHFQANVWSGSSDKGNLGLDERYPASSLRLDEIILLDNATLAKLQTVDGIRTPGDPQPVPALTNATATGYFPNGPITSYDNINNVLDVNDLSDDSRIKNFVYANAIRRIHFNYGYDLCRGTPNSFAYPWSNTQILPPMTEAQMSQGRGGKLTLKGISVFGPSVANTPTKIIPDFTFNYGGQSNNPNYSKECWDGFGMYRPSGQRDITSHNAIANPSAPWSLSRITSPLGGTTDISYERDTYAHVSERGTTKIRLYNTDCSREFMIDRKDFRGELSDFIKPNVWLPITGTANYQCSRLTIPVDVSRKYNCQYVQVESFVQVGNSGRLTLKPAFQPTPDMTGKICTSTSFPGPGGMSVETALPENKPGGDIRVAAITTTDEMNNAYQVKYQYTTDAKTLLPNLGFVPMANSSGVISKEPSFIGRFQYEFEGNYDYPSTPVIYGQVTVFRGRIADNSNNWDQREVYYFYTPESEMVSNVLSSLYNTVISPYNGGFNNINVELYANQTSAQSGELVTLIFW